MLSQFNRHTLNYGNHAHNCSHDIQNEALILVYGGALLRTPHPHAAHKALEVTDGR